MDINVISQVISSLGFPIFVAVYMLLKSSNDSKKICECLIRLEKVILILAERCKKNNAD